MLQYHDAEILPFEELNFPTSPRDREMLLDAKRTIPNGVEILEDNIQRTTVELKDGNFDLLVFRLYVPHDKEASLKRWVDDYEKRYAIKVMIQRHAGYNGIKNLFKYAFKDDELLTREHIDKLNFIEGQFLGIPPKPPRLGERIERLKNLPTRSDLPFIAIDSYGTEDPEDAFCAKQLPNGGYLLSVAISDISWMIDPRGQSKEYALRLGSTLYGSTKSVSTLGNLANSSYSHLVFDDLRPAWLMQFVVRPDKQTKMAVEPKPVLVQVHQNYVPEDLVGELSPELRDLMSVAVMLKAERTGKILDPSQLKDPRVSYGLLVSEIMIKTKEGFATYLNKYCAKHAIFKVQQRMTQGKRRELWKAIRKLDLFQTPEFFENPFLMIDFLTELQDINFNEMINNGRDATGSGEIASEILDVLLKRSHYESHNRGHLDLGVRSYCDIKGRLAAGIINQIQARSITDKNIREYSVAEIIKMTSYLNRQMRNYGIKVYTLRFLEMLRGKLAMVGQTFTGEVAQIKDGMAYIEIENFKKWGLVPVKEGTEVGSTVAVKLKGYSLKRQRFLFEY